MAFISATFKFIFFNPFKLYFGNISEALNNFVSTVTAEKKKCIVFSITSYIRIIMNKIHMCILNRRGPKMIPVGNTRYVVNPAIKLSICFHDMLSVADNHG